MLRAGVYRPPAPAIVLPPASRDHLARAAHWSGGARLVDPTEAAAGLGREGVPVELHHTRRYARVVTVAVLTLAFVLTWAGSALLIDASPEHRRRPSLSERLAPYMATVGGEAEVWLRRQ